MSHQHRPVSAHPSPHDHVFDAELAAKMQLMYTSTDVARRRKLVHGRLAVRPGQTILDVGCGPGFSVADIADLVGVTGSVIGVDASPQMLAAAQRRCARHTNARFHQGDVTSLPLASASVDAVLCVQVLEYVADPGAVLAGLARVVRPGGQVVIWDVDWSTVSWHSRHPDRVRQVLTAFDEHVTHRALPRTLVSTLRTAGFTDISIDGHCFTSTTLSPDSYAGAVVWPVIERFVIGRDGITAEQAQAWAREQHELDARGEFFFTCTQSLVAASEKVESAPQRRPRGVNSGRCPGRQSVQDALQSSVAVRVVRLAVLPAAPDDV